MPKATPPGSSTTETTGWSKKSGPRGQQTAYQYDDAGNLTTKIDAKNQKNQYDYDDAGRRHV